MSPDNDTIDTVNIGTGLDLIGRTRSGKAKPIACCPRCPDEVPLIGTMVFCGAEFYCLECGARVGFLSPRSVEPSEEMNARYERLQAEWDEHADDLIPDGREPRDEDAGCDARPRRPASCAGRGHPSRRCAPGSSPSGGC